MAPQALGRAAAARSCAEAVQAGRVVYADHADLPVIPASNMKLLTATAVLDRLGPSLPVHHVAGGPRAAGRRGRPWRSLLRGGRGPVAAPPELCPVHPRRAAVVYTDVTRLVAALKAAGPAR